MIDVERQRNGMSGMIMTRRSLKTIHHVAMNTVKLGLANGRYCRLIHKKRK